MSYAAPLIASPSCEGLAPAPGVTVAALPCDLQSITLTKREHVELVTQCNYWKNAHRRALARLEWSNQRQRITLNQAALAQEALRVQMRQQMRQAEQCHRDALECARQIELGLRAQLELAQARIRDLRKRHSARKSEQTRTMDKASVDAAPTYRCRGQQSGAPGHGRTCQDHLPTVVQTIALQASCPECGRDLKAFPGTQDCEVLEIEVKAYRRIIRRQRYKPCCEFACLPAIVTAPAPPRLIAHGKLGESVWVNILVSKFLYTLRRVPHSLPSSSVALLASTVLTFVWVCVPEPLCQTSLQVAAMVSSAGPAPPFRQVIDRTKRRLLDRTVRCHIWG